MIPPTENGAFVAAMEQVLDVYRRPYSVRYPVVNMDESTKQLIGETKIPLPMKSGQAAKYDYEYIRRGVCNIFMANEALRGRRFVKITERKTKIDWAIFMKAISDDYYKEAERITIVMDNFGTHTPGAFYETFEPVEAKRILDRFEFVYTPKHGSWLNVAEIELNVLFGQCLNRRIDNIETMKKEVEAWQKDRNGKEANIDWQFTLDNARIKLKRLYPNLNY